MTPITLNQNDSNKDNDCQCKFCQTTLTTIIPELKDQRKALSKEINDAKDYGSVLGLPEYEFDENKAVKAAVNAICFFKLETFRLCIAPLDTDEKTALESKFLQNPVI